MAKSKRYVRNQTEVFAISRSKIENFIQCPRCFVLDRRHGVAAPSGPSFTLNSAVDSLLKKEFDRHREAGTVHPILKQLGVELIPFKHENMNIWRENFKGVRYLHEPTNLEVFGAVDDLWVNADGELVVVDYKSTAKANPVEELGNERWHDAYRRQIEVYQWLLRQLGFKVSNVGYWLYETARNNAESFDQKLDFDARLIAHEGETLWVEWALHDIKAALNREELPWSNDNCETCRFVEARNAVVKPSDAETTKRCEVCSSRLKKAFYGMPSGPVDENKYSIQGCVIPMGELPEWVCDTCGS